MIDTHMDTHAQTDADNDNTQKPKLASGKNQQPNHKINQSYSHPVLGITHLIHTDTAVYYMTFSAWLTILEGNFRYFTGTYTTSHLIPFPVVQQIEP